MTIQNDPHTPVASPLSGRVSPWAEHGRALEAAWAAPRVSSVDARFRVEY